MFANLEFCMVNSMGAKASVRLSVNEGLVEYEIFFPDDRRRRPRSGCLGGGDSEQLLDRLVRSGVLDILRSLIDVEPDEHGDYWSISFLDMEGRQLSISGPEKGSLLMASVVDDLAEVLDDQFHVTRYIRPKRLESIEVDFAFNELPPEMIESLNAYPNCDHTELLRIERKGRSIRFRRFFPLGCCRLDTECRCEREVKAFLDQTGNVFDEEYLFEDVDDDPDSPGMTFVFEYRDGTVRRVRRSLSIVGLRDDEYLEMVDFLFGMLMRITFRRGLFDKRYILFPDRDMDDVPYFSVYSDGDVDLEDEEEGQT